MHDVFSLEKKLTNVEIKDEGSLITANYTY